jgi:hypothetical protein
MSCYFDIEKINKSTQISELFTFEMSEAAAWCSTALGMKNTSLGMKNGCLTRRILTRLTENKFHVMSFIKKGALVGIITYEELMVIFMT